MTNGNYFLSGGAHALIGSGTAVATVVPDNTTQVVAVVVQVVVLLVELFKRIFPKKDK
jgi:hypothetical protein